MGLQPQELRICEAFRDEVAGPPAYIAGRLALIRVTMRQYISAGQRLFIILFPVMSLMLAGRCAANDVSGAVAGSPATASGPITPDQPALHPILADQAAPTSSRG